MLTWKQIITFAVKKNPKPNHRVEKSNSEWKTALPIEVYRITRQHETERPFSSDVCSKFDSGLYACVCCNELLFDADVKFESGSGWPSFTQPVNVSAIAYTLDRSYGMARVEVICNCCDAHLGHVFPDGPPPSGLRYCINAASLVKIKNSDS